jgi:DNA-binding phage protein
MVNGNLSMAKMARQVGCAPSTLYRSLPGGRPGSTTVVAGRQTMEMSATA